MKLFPTLCLFLLLAGLAGCNGETADHATVTPDPATITTPDTEPADDDDDSGDGDQLPEDSVVAPTIAEVSVDGKQLLPDGRIVVKFTAPVTPSAVADAVRLRNATGTVFIPVETKLAEDGLSVEVRAPHELEQETDYVLEIDLTAIASASSPGSTATVAGKAENAARKVAAFLVRIRSHNPLHIISFDEDGVAWLYGGWQYENEGRAWNRLTSNDAGVNGTWGDEDDNLISFSRHVIGSDGNEYIYTYSGPGADGDWLTQEDNVLDTFERRHRIPVPDVTTLENTSRLVSRDPGADGEWFTGDDEYDHAGLAHFDAATGVSIKIIGNDTDWGGVGPGPDRTWLTGDDHFQDYRARHYDDSLRLVRRTEYIHRGSDDLWFTGDDTVLRYSAITYDAQGWRSTITYFTDPGDDGLWFTADDRGDGQYRYEYLSGERDLFESWFESGLDEIPGTGDDVFREYTYWRGTREGKTLAFGKFDGPGFDGEWFTDDDVLGSDDWLVGTVDMFGRVATTRHYGSLGPDGRRFTGDDGPVTDMNVYEYTDQGVRRKLTHYQSPGPNGEWGDDDDIPGFVYEYLEQ